MASYTMMSVPAHLAMFCTSGYAMFARLTYVDKLLPYSGQTGGPWQFLTFWNVNFQVFYFGLCAFIDVILSFNQRSKFGGKLCRFRDWFLAAVAFPFGTLVAVMFWSLYAIDRELVFPKWMDEVFPMWLNHVMHTAVVPFLLVDMYLIQHNYPSRKSGVTGTIFVGLAYLLWILYLGFVLDIWVYKVLKVLSGVHFVLFFVVAAVLLLCIYVFGEKVNSSMWGSKGRVNIEEEIDKVD